MDRAGRQQLMTGLRWLGAREERRLVEVVIAPQSRDAALALAAVAEHAGDLPHVVLEAPWTAQDGGFPLRTDELLLRRDELTGVARRAGVALPERVASPNAEGAPAPDRFVRELADLLDALPATIEGLVVVLAPRFVDDARAMSQSVEALATAPALARARWAVIAHAPGVADLTARMGARAALSVDARLDEQAAATRITDDLERAAFAAGASGAAAVGTAAPRGVAAPVRRRSDATDPLRPDRTPLPSPSPPHAAEPAPSPVEGPTLFERLRALVLRAAANASRGSFVAAMAPMREARDLCFLHGRDEDGVRMEIMLASYVSAAGAREQAIQILETARAHAHEATLPALACQAELARASMLSTVPDLPRAAAAFADAGSFAEVAEQPLLALEGYRLSGEAALTAGLEPQAVDAWAKALVVAGDAPDPSLMQTTAEIAARLAHVCVARGLVAQAASLRARATSLRATETPSEPVVEPVPRPEPHPLIEEPAATAPSAQLVPPPPPPEALPFTPTPQGITPPTTPAFREAPIADVPRNRVPAELKGTVRLEEPDEPSARPTRDEVAPRRSSEQA